MSNVKYLGPREVSRCLGTHRKNDETRGRPRYTLFRDGQGEPLCAACLLARLDTSGRKSLNFTYLGEPRKPYPVATRIRCNRVHPRSTPDAVLRVGGEPLCMECMKAEMVEYLRPVNPL
jgi:hypothetical protein